MTPDPIPAVLDQLAAHHEQISLLDTRETGHFTALNRRLTELTDLVNEISRTLHDHAVTLARLEALDLQVTDLAAQMLLTARPRPTPYRSGPPWWKLPADQRREPLSRLRAWVEQVYRPGYGHLAATLGPCWDAHDLCLYGLDILADLWSVLYLQPSAAPGCCPPRPNTKPASCPH